MKILSAILVLLLVDIHTYIYVANLIREFLGFIANAPRNIN